MWESLESRRLCSAAVDALHNLKVIGSDGADRISARADGDSIVVNENGTESRFPLAGVGELWVSGGAGNDRIVVENDVGVPVLLDGGDGDDVLVAGRARATLDGGAGDDRLLGGPGIDTLRGGTGADALSGGDGDDRLSGGNGGPGGPDGDDRLYGGAGADVCGGGEGDDVILGGAGDDDLTGDGGGDRLVGGRGDDQLVGHAGDDRLDGGPGHDSLAGNVSLFGDVPLGASGRDILRGGPGRDVVNVASRHDAVSGAEAIERNDLPGRPLGTAADPVDARITVSASDTGSYVAAVVLNVPAGTTVRWGDPVLEPADGGLRFTVEATGVGRPDRSAPAVEQSRTFELGSGGLTGQATNAYTFEVTSRGRTLASEQFDAPAIPLPAGTPDPYDAPVPVGLTPGNVSVGLRNEGGRLVAEVFLGYREPGDVATVGAPERVGNEFFITARLTHRFSTALITPAPLLKRFELDGLSPGEYAFNVQGRAGGVTATRLFQVLS